MKAPNANLHLRTTIDALAASLARGSDASTWTVAHARHAPLAPFDSPKKLGEVLRKSAIAGDDRARLIDALLAERQASADPMWSTLLVLAFERMLVNSVRYVRSGACDGAQNLMLAFLEAIAKVKPGQFAVRELYFVTLRGLPRRAKNAPEWVPYDSFEEGLPDPGIERPEPLRMDVSRVANDVGGRQLAVALMEAALCGSLRDYVDLTCTPSERETALARLDDGRRKVAERLRRHIPRVA